MKSLALLLIISTVLAQDRVKCPAEKPQACTLQYTPTCGITVDGNIYNTFGNECEACSHEKIGYYIHGSCSDIRIGGSDGSNSSTNPNAPVSSPPAISYVKCATPRSTESCPKNIEKTCGVFSGSVQCIRAPCAADYDNPCFACQDEKVEAYFVGSCSTIPIALPSEPGPQPDTTQQNLGVSECKVRSEVCPAIFIDSCGFTEYPCLSTDCMVKFGSGCDACSKSNIKAYVEKSCDSYLNNIQIYMTGAPGVGGNSQTSAEKTDQKSENNKTPIKNSCPNAKPEMCPTVVQKVCGVISNCTSKVCEKAFSNSCEACKDPSVQTYYDGQCVSQTANKALLALGFAVLTILV